MPTVQQPFQNVEGCAELGKITAIQRIEMGCEVLDTPLASLLKKARAFGRGADRHAARIVWISGSFDEAAALEPSGDAAHRGGLDLFGGGEFSESFRTSKDQNRERGKLGRTDARGRILFAYAAEQVDGGGMKTVGGSKRLRPEREVFGLHTFGLDVFGLGVFELDIVHRI
jgi:hypothetical protein